MTSERPTLLWRQRETHPVVTSERDPPYYYVRDQPCYDVRHDFSSAHWKLYKPRDLGLVCLQYKTYGRENNKMKELTCITQRRRATGSRAANCLQWFRAHLTIRHWTQRAAKARPEKAGNSEGTRWQFCHPVCFASSCFVGAILSEWKLCWSLRTISFFNYFLFHITLRLPKQ